MRELLVGLEAHQSRLQQSNPELVEIHRIDHPDPDDVLAVDLGDGDLDADRRGRLVADQSGEPTLVVPAPEKPIEGELYLSHRYGPLPANFADGFADAEVRPMEPGIEDVFMALMSAPAGVAA